MRWGRSITDNGFEWTDRCAGRVRAQAGDRHPLDQWCAAAGVRQVPTAVRRPQTKAERMNRRLSEALAAKERIKDNSGKNCFAGHAERNAYIRNVAHNYNRTRLKCLNYKSPLETIALITNQAKTYTFVGMTSV